MTSLSHQQGYFLRTFFLSSSPCDELKKWWSAPLKEGISVSISPQVKDLIWMKDSPFSWEQSIYRAVIVFLFAPFDDTNRSLTVRSTSYHVAVVRGIDTNDALWTNLIIE